ncbi:hypothetical protein G6F22_008248 [Rhizopus arrhizus]|nr:hypothetical protein G6F22_008248 [Rhizopus arrhizus]
MVPWADAVPARARPAAANEVASNSGVDRNDMAHPCGRRKGAVTAGTALRGGLPAPPRRPFPQASRGAERMRWASRDRRGADHVVEATLRGLCIDPVRLAREAAMRGVVQLHERHRRVGEQRIQLRGDVGTRTDLGTEHQRRPVVGTHRDHPPLHVGRHHAGWQHAPGHAALYEDRAGRVIGRVQGQMDMRQQEQFAATGRVAQADPAGMAAAITGPAALDAQRGKRSVVLLEQVLERAVVEATEVPRVHGQLLDARACPGRRAPHVPGFSHHHRAWLPALHRHRRRLLAAADGAARATGTAAVDHQPVAADAGGDPAGTAALPAAGACRAGRQCSGGRLWPDDAARGGAAFAAATAAVAAAADGGGFHGLHLRVPGALAGPAHAPAGVQCVRTDRRWLDCLAAAAPCTGAATHQLPAGGGGVPGRSHAVCRAPVPAGGARRRRGHHAHRLADVRHLHCRGDAGAGALLRHGAAAGRAHAGRPAARGAHRWPDRPAQPQRGTGRWPGAVAARPSAGPPLGAVAGRCRPFQADQRPLGAPGRTHLLGRYGGEEFVLGLAGSTSSDAVMLAAVIRTRLQRHPAVLVTGPVAVTASVGLAMDEGQGDLSTLLAAADAALYQAKAAGRDQLACAPAAAISPFPIAVEAVPV